MFMLLRYVIIIWLFLGDYNAANIAKNNNFY